MCQVKGHHHLCEECEEWATKLLDEPCAGCLHATEAEKCRWEMRDDQPEGE